MKKVAIPVLHSGQPEIDAAFAAAKQNLDNLTGQQRNTVAIKPLASTASTADIIARVNALIDRLEG